MNNKKIIIILTIFSVIFLSLGGTLAYWNWESENTLITFTVDDAFMCSADVGGDVTSSYVSLAPAECTNEKNAIKKRLMVYPTVLGDLTVGLDLWLEIKSMSPELGATEHFRYAVTKDENSCTDSVVASGSFNGKQVGDTVELLKQQIYRESIYTGDEYWLYIWLDAAETSLSTANKSFNFVLNGTCKDHFEGYNFMVNFDSNGGDSLGTTTTFTTVGEHTYTVPMDGSYKLEVWGAQGGYASSEISYPGGYGGYSNGEMSLTTGTILYVNVGGRGTGSTSMSSQSYAGGYNGGGTGYGETDKYASGGGGATHIATSSGTISSLFSANDSILIVAGGGGGTVLEGAYHGVGGGGGGYIGTDGVQSVSGSTYSQGYGGSQESGGSSAVSSGSFGQGGNHTTNGGPGGGGGYYGGGAGQYLHGAGGGSGYIGNSLLTNKAMYCYECTTSSNVDTLTYSTTNVSDVPTANYAKSGDGAARITKIDGFSKDVVGGDTYGTLPIPTREGHKFVGWNTKADGSGQTITNTSIVNISGDTTLYAIWELLSYTISYSANGGSGAPAAQTKYYGETLTLSSTVPTRTEYTFLGWSTSPTATSASYEAGGSYTVNESATLYAVWKPPSTIPVFTYTGDYEIVDDNDNVITETTGNWKIRFLSSGTLTFTELNGATDGIDVFLVGGGGGGGGSGTTYYCGSGGGSGRTKTVRGISISIGEEYEIVVGAGGASNQSGGSSSAFTYSASGGGGGTASDSSSGMHGGSGGSGGSSGWGGVAGGTNGGNGTSTGSGTAGSGQGSTTREFGESSGTLYAQGGGATGGGTPYIPNSGNGGDGDGSQTKGVNAAKSGSSGIVIIRNAR